MIDTGHLGAAPGDTEKHFEPQDRSSSVAHSIEVPSEIIRKWQEIVNLLAEIMHVPSASIMRVDPPHIKVLVSSTSKGNPCEPGALDTGPYCETVMKTGQPLLVPDALENEAWKANPHVRLGMISYLGVPIGWPDGRLFGTICVRDNKRNEYSEAYLKLLLHFRDMLQADLKSLVRLHGEIEDREAKIRHSEANLAEAQRLSHTGSWSLSPATTKILYWSEECYRIWGVDPVQGLPNREAVWRRIIQAIETGCTGRPRKHCGRKEITRSISESCSPMGQSNISKQLAIICSPRMESLSR